MAEEEKPSLPPEDLSAVETFAAEARETSAPASSDGFAPQSDSPMAGRMPGAESGPPLPGPPADRRRVPRGPRSELLESHEPLFREAGGYRLRFEPADLARLRELPGAKGKTDRELGESFFDGQAARLTEALAGDVDAPADVRVVVDPYSRQAFLAVGKTIRGIVSF
jgi:hypothetical protein